MDNVSHLSKLWHEYLRLSRNCATLAERLKNSPLFPKKWNLFKDYEFLKINMISIFPKIFLKD